MRGRDGLWLPALAFVIFALSAPSVINGDGLGYVRAARTAELPPPVPGHLLYLPLLALVRRLAGGALLEGARLVSALGGALTVAATMACARRLLGGRRAALIAGAGVAVSHGLWVQAADVETYAVAAACSTSALAVLAGWSTRPVAHRAALAGALVSLGALFHVANALAALALAGWLLAAPTAVPIAPRTRLGHLVLAGATTAVVVAGAYAAVAFAWLDLTPAAAWRWFRGAGHGFVYLVRPYNLTDAICGLARTLVVAPYVHEADAQVALGQTLLGAAALGVLAGIVVWRWRALPPLPLVAFATWAAPTVVLALLFFGNDSERWIFVLPVGWILFAAATGTLPVERERRLATGLVGALFVVNLATGIVPAIADITPRWRARAVEAHAAPGDLVIFPGHDWDELVGFHGAPGLRVFPLTYYVGAHGREAALEGLADQIRYARNRGGQVWLVRVLGDRPEPRGWEELGLLGFGRAEAARYFREAYDVTPLDPVRGVDLARIEDTAHAPPRARRVVGP